MNREATTNQNFQYELKLEYGYIYCTLSGEVSTMGISSLLKESIQLTERTEINRVLCDTSRASITKPHHLVGISLECIKTSSGKGQKTAAIMGNRKLYAFGKFLCLVTKNNSWKPFFTNQREDALRWLMA